MLGSTAAAVWLENGEGRLSLQCQRQLSNVEGLADTAAATRHGRLLEHVRNNGEAMLAAPESVASGNGEAGNPTGYLLVLAPLKNHRQTVGDDFDGDAQSQLRQQFIGDPLRIVYCVFDFDF